MQVLFNSLRTDKPYPVPILGSSKGAVGSGGTEGSCCCCKLLTGGSWDKLTGCCRLDTRLAARLLTDTDTGTCTAPEIMQGSLHSAKKNLWGPAR